MADIEFKNFGDYSKDTIASAAIKNMECGKGKTIKRYALVKDYLLPPGSWPESLPPDYCNARYDDMISKLMDSFINSGLEVKPDENGVYNLKYTGSYKLFIEDSEGKYTVVSKELPKPSQADTKPPEIDFDVTIPASENETSEIKVTAADNIGVARIDYADVEFKQIGESDNGTDEFFLTERKPISASGETIKTDRSIVICAIDTSGNASYERVDIDNEPEPTNEPDETSSPIPSATAEPKPTEAPKISYTLSETDDTWNPISVNLNITDDEDIAQVRFVRMSQSRHGLYPPYEDGIDSGSVPYDVDCFSLFLPGSDKTSEEELKELEKICGGLEQGIIAESYYLSAFIDNVIGDEKYTDYSTEVIGNTFTVYQNSPYIIYAEDKSGNKSFKFFEVKNIKLTSAEVELNVYPDFSEEYIAEAKLNNIVENPNAGIKNIYVYRVIHELASAGVLDEIRATQQTIAGYQKYSQMIEPINGVYYLKDLGEYRVILEDEWGNYSFSRFTLSPSSDIRPPIECSTKSDGSQFTVDVRPDGDDIAKLEYVKCEERYEGIAEPTDEDLFALGTDRTKITDKTFTAQAGQKYAVRALYTDGSAAYGTVTIDAPSKNYRYEISGLSILTQSGEALGAPPENGSFEAEVTLKKLKDESSKDYVFVAVYNEEGILLNIDYVRADFAPDYDYSFGFNIPPQMQKIGSIKAFVWSGFNSAKPLAETKEINF